MEPNMDTPPDSPADQPAIDPAQLRSIVGLPPDAPDSALIGELAIVIAAQKSHIDTLETSGAAKDDEKTELENACAAKDEEIANHFLAVYADVIPQDSFEFWKGQFLTNRDETLKAVDALLNARPAPAAPVAAVVSQPQAGQPVQPIRNRLVDRPKAIDTLIAGPTTTAQQAESIRNRASVLQKELGLTFPQAWDRASAEFQKPQE